MRIVFLFIAISFGVAAWAQDEDLLKGMRTDEPQKAYVFNMFKSSRVIMSQSVEMLQPGVLDFRILHRFGNVNQGIKELFGLDQASIRLGLDYGIAKNITIGAGRSTYKKSLDGFVKWRAVQQATGPGAFPVSVVVVGGTTLMGGPWSNPVPKYAFKHRMGYFAQLLFGRKFSEALSIQLAPTYLHRNLVETAGDNNKTFAMGFGGRIKMTKRTSINWDYYYVADQNKARDLHNPLSVGVDIETGGHVFQLHFTNAVGMNERVFLTETTNSWGKGDIQFGFNISRAFQLGEKRKTNN
jgi:hypothetical protein